MDRTEHAIEMGEQLRAERLGVPDEHRAIRHGSHRPPKKRRELVGRSRTGRSVHSGPEQSLVQRAFNHVRSFHLCAICAPPTSRKTWPGWERNRSPATLPWSYVRSWHDYLVCSSWRESRG